MLEFGKTRRALLAKQFSDGANMAGAALIFGQYIRGRDFSPVAFGWGCGLWLLFGAVAVLVAGKEDS